MAGTRPAMTMVGWVPPGDVCTCGAERPDWTVEQRGRQIPSHLTKISDEI
jgi:hypothetical protein